MAEVTEAEAKFISITANGAKMGASELITVPSKGGDNKDVTQHNPPCGDGTGNVGRCVMIVVPLPKGSQVIDHELQIVPLDAGVESIVAVALNADLAYSMFFDYQENVENVPGFEHFTCATVRFKNWSHDRARIVRLVVSYN